MKENKRNGTIEFLRFVFCMCILLFHIEKYVLGEASLKNGIHLAFFPHGSLGVEFFFLVTGLMLAKSIDKELQDSQKKQNNIGEDTAKYVFKKFKAIFFYHIIAFIILFIIQAIISKYTIYQSIITIINSIPSMFFLQMTGIPSTTLNHIEWYLSAMMICVAIIYPLCKKYYKTFVTLIAPIVSILILGYLGHNYSRLTGVMVWTVFTYKSVLRGFAEILLGTTIYYISQKITKMKLKKSQTIMLTIFEVILYAICLIIILCTFPSKYEFTVLIMLFLGIILTYSQITYTSKIFNRKIFYVLGKLSLPIYLSQLSAIKIANEYFNNFSFINIMALIIGLTFLFAIITKISGDYILRKINKKHKLIAK